LGLGLREAKNLVESVPIVIRDNILKSEAEALKESLEGVGASVEIV